MTTQDLREPARGIQMDGAKLIHSLRTLIACLVGGYNSGRGGWYYAICACIQQRTDHFTR